MCGICGIYEYGSQRPADADVAWAMAESIRHRGPDDGGVHAEGPIALANRRLSIIDVAGGHQPIVSEDGNVVVVFNGEIYNYRELVAGLRARGHRITTSCDTEVVVHLYEELGDDCVRELRGMFAFAVWDARQHRLLLARDRLGIKPLYYADDGRRLVFGSEIKAILCDPDVAAALDLGALANFVSLKYVPAPQTMFAGIAALPPAHVLTCETGRARTAGYWDVSFASPDRTLSEPEQAERLSELLRESVRDHLMSDVPFGAFLSGGVDSSTIVALMSLELGQPVKTFSVGFDGDGAEYSEARYARIVADRFATDHYEISVRAEHFVDLAEKTVWHLDQPIADEAALANLLLAELAASHVKMVLTGEGGDELFAGYARYAWERWSHVAQRVPRQCRGAALAFSARLPGLRRPKIALRALCEPDPVTRLVTWFPLFNPEMRAALGAGAALGTVDARSADAVFAEHLARADGPDALSRMLYVDSKLWLPDDLLARGDKMSMAASLEARVPLLDHRLVEFAATVPSSLKVHRLARKHLLREVSRRWLPDEIVDRPKKGFPIPISVWFRGAARPFVRDILSPARLGCRGLFDPAYVGRLLDEHESGFADNGSLIWALVSVELWHQLFIDGGGRRPVRAMAAAGEDGRPLHAS